MTDGRPDMFVRGALTGVAVAVVLAELVLANQFRSFAGMYRDLGGEVPALTRLATSAPWLWGLPVVGTTAIAVLFAKRPASLAIYIAVVALVLGAAALTVYGAYQPIFALSGNIRPD